MTTILRTCLAAGILALVACGDPGADPAASSAGTTRLTVGLPVATSTFLPLYLAQDEGFFEAEGLDVELLAFRGGSDLIRALASDSVEVGVVSLAEVTQGIKAGQPLKAFYAGFNVPAFDWYAVPGIATLAEARGRRFGVTQYGSSTDFMTRYALATHGLDPQTDVQIVQGGDSPTRLAAMEAGQIDVNVFAAPEKFIAAERGYARVLSQRELAPDYPYHVFAAKEAFVSERAGAVRALLRGHVRGLRLAKQDRARALRALTELLDVDPVYAERTYEDFIDDLYEDGRLPGDRGLEVFFQMGITAGRYEEPWPKERYWIPDYVATYAQWKPAP